MFRPITYITQLWSGLPKLVRFMSYHATWGMVLGCMVVFGVIWTDFAGVGTLLESDASGLATLIFFAQMALTFGAVAIGVAVMCLAEDD